MNLYLIKVNLFFSWNADSEYLEEQHALNIIDIVFRLYYNILFKFCAGKIGANIPVF